MFDAVMFDFRLIETEDGSQIIDRNLKTPINALTPDQQMEYIEIDSQLATVDRMKRRARRKAEHKRRIKKSLAWKIACLCGIF